MAGILSKDEWRKRRHRKRVITRTITILAMVTIVLSAALLIKHNLPEHIVSNIQDIVSNNQDMDTLTTTLSCGEAIKTEFLTPNPYSRPQTALKRIKGVVVHYTANPGTTAENNRSYFEGLKEKQTTYASSHYIIGLEGEIIQCIPLTEESFASNDRNKDTISIECCHPDETGKFSDKTYESLVSLVAALCTEFKLDKEDIIRHYDVTGKLCPLYYVEHEDAWETFREDALEELAKYK